MKNKNYCYCHQYSEFNVRMFGAKSIHMKNFFSFVVVFMVVVFVVVLIIFLLSKVLFMIYDRTHCLGNTKKINVLKIPLFERKFLLVFLSTFLKQLVTYLVPLKQFFHNDFYLKIVKSLWFDISNTVAFPLESFASGVNYMLGCSLYGFA